MTRRRNTDETALTKTQHDELVKRRGRNATDRAIGADATRRSTDAQCSEIITGHNGVTFTPTSETTGSSPERCSTGRNQPNGTTGAQKPQKGTQP